VQSNSPEDRSDALGALTVCRLLDRTRRLRPSIMAGAVPFAAKGTA